MFRFSFTLTRILVLILFSFCQFQSAKALEPDPFFTVDGITYNFGPPDCDPVTVGAQACANPIQASVNFLNGTAPSSPWFGVGATPDDGNIYVEGGTYEEYVVIDGAAGWNSGANTPEFLGLIGAGSTASIVDGGFTITNMNNLTLTDFAVNDADYSGNVAAILAHNNHGVLKLSHLTVTSIDPGTNPTDHIGDAIRVHNHSGDIVLTHIDASNNSEWGAWLDNSGTTGSGQIWIEFSNFSANWAGLQVSSNEDITLSDVNVSDNIRGGTSLDNCNYISLVCTGSGNIFVSSSTFNHNDDGIATSHTIGLVAESNGNIHLSQVAAHSNNSHGALLVNYFEGSTGAVLVESSEFINNGQGEIGDGIDIRSRGDVSILNVTSELNLEHGVDVYNGYGGAIAKVVVERSQAHKNGLSGLKLAANGNISIVDTSVNENSHLWGSSNAIQAYTSANITLSGVTAAANEYGGALLDNKAGSGSILVESSTFNLNEAGLIAESKGDITFQDVIANHNRTSGANALNCQPSGFVCAGTGQVIINSSEFNNNGPVGIASPHWSGLVVYSRGNILLTNVSASSNNYHGAVLFNYYSNSTGMIHIKTSEFNLNGQGGELGDGLKPQSRGEIRLQDVIANGNLEKGVEGGNRYAGALGAILVKGGEFSRNGVQGMELGTNKNISLSDVVIEKNGLMGAFLRADSTVTISCSAVLNHAGHLGIDGMTPLLTLKGVHFAGNGINFRNTGRVVVNLFCK